MDYACTYVLLNLCRPYHGL